MCDHCGCSAIDLIGRLMREHEDVQSLTAQLQGHVRRHNNRAAYDVLENIGLILLPHIRVEEDQLFPAYRDEEVQPYIEKLKREHASATARLSAFLAQEPIAILWSKVLSLLEDLREHMYSETEDLFKAAPVMMDMS